jgi:hypothetical protein
MAIKSNFTATSIGFTAPEAYIKIDTFYGNINQVTFNVLVYANETARMEGKSHIDGFNFTVPYTDGMTYNAVYSYLKTLPGMENAVDC